MIIPTTRERILNAAFALFYKGGFHATGVDRVVEAAGVTRMTLYKYFPSKEDLIIAVLERRNVQWMEWFKQRVEALAIEPKERLLAIYDALLEWFSEEDFCGCAFINAAAEFSSREHPAHRIAADHVHAIRAYIYELCLTSGVKEAQLLATQLTLLADGAIVVAYVGGDLQCATLAKEAARTLLEA